MTTTDAEARWEGRVWAARAVRALVFLAPIVAAVVVAVTVSRLLPRPEGTLGVVLWWVAVIGSATAAMILVDRLARRALPLAVLMQMTMLFPDRAPSRMKVLRLAGSTKRLEERLEASRSAGDAEMADVAENVLALAAALNDHDRLTRGHAERVRIFTDLIAEELQLDDTSRDKLRWAALLHDIGKLDVHSDILNKPGRPTDEEWERLRSHPLHGARILGPLAGWLGDWAPAVEEHHEKYDGTGYPTGLAGGEISYAARIVAVADSYDAITSARSYKQPISAGIAREELARSAGTHFDPNVVRAFLNVSLGKLRWVIGPASWFAQIPFVGGLERIGRDLAILAAALLALFAAFGVGAVEAPRAVAAPPAVTTQPGPDAVGGSSAATAPDPTADPLQAPPTTAPSPSTSTPPTTTAPSTTAAPPTTTDPPPTSQPDATTSTTSTTTTTTTLVVLLPPEAIDDATATDEDTPITIAVTANDSDLGGGTVAIVGADAEAASGGIVACGATTCSYTPSVDFNGTDTFTYRIANEGGLVDSATVTIVVAPVNDPPLAREDTATVGVGGSVSVTVLANDSDPEGDPRTIVGFEATSSAGGEVICTTSCAYRAPAGFTGVDTFTYTVGDGRGGTATAVVTVTVG